MENICLSLQIQQPTQQTNPPPPPPQQPHMAVLHSVRKPPAKPWKRSEPPPPRVYHCEPRGFRKLVQKLTGAPKKVARPLRDMLVPPPPLDLAPRAVPPPQPPFQYNCSGVQTSKPATPLKSSADHKGFIGMLSPSLCSPYARWCSFPLLSPRTMASLELSNSPIL